MVEQLAGAASASIIILAYLILLQAMTGIMLLLGQFLVLQVRSLRSMIAKKPSSEMTPAPEPYKVGGGLMRWD